MGMTAPVAGMLAASIAGPVLSAMFAPEGQELQSFSDVPGLNPATYLGDVNGLMAELGRVLSNQASQPVSLPSAYVQQPGAYTGGGLPMPIGVVGMDPALANPSLLTKPGADMTGMAELFSKFKGDPLDYAGIGGPGARRPNNSTPPGAGIQGPDTIIPGSGIDPDGPLGPDGELGNAFDDFYQPQFDQRSPQNPGGTTNGAEPGDRNAAERVGPGARLLEDRTPGPLDDVFSQADNLVGGDDFDQGIANAQLLMGALSRGDIDINSILGHAA